MNFKNFDGAQEFIPGPVRLRNGGEFRNVIHTVIDGFAVDWTVLNFDNRSVHSVTKYPTSQERCREYRSIGRISIPGGTWTRLKEMALQELDKEVARRQTTKIFQTMARSGTPLQQSLF